MDERLHLHEGERLLCSIQPSSAFFVQGMLRGALDALLGGFVLGLMLIILLSMSDTSLTVMWGVIVIVVSVLLVYCIVSVLRWRRWRQSSLRITNERLLLQYPTSLFRTPLKTIKWGQYQESFLAPRGTLDLLFRVRTLSIRYGNADSQLFASFPSLPFADDLKHYLDKVDSAVRKKESDGLKPFIPKPRGERDV